MSKYILLWEYVKNSGKLSLKMTFDEIHDVIGIPIDHSFLKYKKELSEYGYVVEKISMKNGNVLFTERAK